MTYGQYITYTDIMGNKTTCGVSGCETPEQAKAEAVELAKMDGWTNSKWWQWWRTGDTKIK
jgi:hypothetical protein